MTGINSEATTETNGKTLKILKEIVPNLKRSAVPRAVHEPNGVWMTALDLAANIASFGVLWVAKFVIFNKFMFVHHPQDLPEALDGRTGVPT